MDNQYPTRKRLAKPFNATVQASEPASEPASGPAFISLICRRIGLRPPFLSLLILIVLSQFSSLSTLFSKNFFSQLLKGYQTYQKYNTYLWLLGDVGAEKRFGDEMALFLKLTTRKSRDRKLTNWAKGIFKKLVAQTPDRKLPYRLTVLRGKTHNAFAIPGGRIYIYDGMLEFLSSDDEVATVLGHELTHAYRRHSLKALRRDTLFITAIKKLSKSGSREQLIAQVATTLAHFQFSRGNEMESDRLGLKIMKNAGFNPAAGLYVWEKMKKAHGRKRNVIEKFLATHPTNSKRITQMRKLLHESGTPETFDFKYTHFKKGKAQEESAFGDFSGSFEHDSNKDNRPDGVFFLTPGVSWDRTTAHTGKASVKMGASKFVFEDKFTTDFIPVNSGKSYAVSSWMKSRKGERRASFGVELYDSNKRLQKSFFHILNRSVVSVNWKKQSGFLNGNRSSQKFQKTTRFIRLVFKGSGKTSDELWFDDLMVKSGNPAQGRPVDVKGDFDSFPPQVKRVSTWKSSLNAALDRKQFYRGVASYRLDSIANGVPSYLESPAFEFGLGETIRLKFMHRSLRPLKTIVKLVIIDEQGRRLLPRNGKEIKFEISCNVVWTAENRTFNLVSLGVPQSGRLRAYVRFENRLDKGNHFWLDEFVPHRVFSKKRVNGHRRKVSHRKSHRR